MSTTVKFSDKNVKSNLVATDHFVILDSEDLVGGVPKIKRALVNVRDKGYFADLTALQTAIPIGQDGWYAMLGSTDTIWIWDSGTSAWIDTDQKGQVSSVNSRAGAVVLTSLDAIYKMTQAEIDLLTPSEGQTVYNSDLKRLVFYDGTQWIDPISTAAAF